MAIAALYTRSDRVGEEFGHECIRSENRLKRRRQKTVSWPLDEKICEVRHFLVDDAPSLLGASLQEFLQCNQRNAFSYTDTNYHSRIHWLGAKHPRMDQHNHSMAVPPGFNHSSKARKPLQLRSQSDAAMAVTTPWHCPHEFSLDDLWLWARGEESSEIAIQQQREMRLFEACYPRLVSIPDSPLEPQEPNKEIDDAFVPEIPLDPLEEEEMAKDCNMEHGSTDNGGGGAGVPMLGQGEMANAQIPCVLYDDSMRQQQESVVGVADTSIAAAAAAACMVVKALGESDLVDQALLFEILRNPSLLKSLTCSDIFRKGESQGQESLPATRQGSLSLKMPIDHGTHSNGSPVSVLAQWGDVVSSNNLQRMTPFANGSAHLQQSTSWNAPPVGLKPLPRSGLPACSTPDLRRDFAKNRAECAPRINDEQMPQISKTIPFQRSNIKEAPHTCIYVPKDDEMRRSQNGLSKDFETCSSMQTETVRSLPSNIHSTLMPTKDLPQQRHPVQVEPMRSRSAEGSSAFSRKAPPYSASTKAGSRTRKFCMYFNSLRGCRNGERCAFVHQS